MVDPEPGANQNMKHFTSIEKIDTGILYALELTASVSVLLLAFGLIPSMANVLTKGSVLTDNIFMQRIWAWTQCIATPPAPFTRLPMPCNIPNTAQSIWSRNCIIHLSRAVSSAR